MSVCAAATLRVNVRRWRFVRGLPDSEALARGTANARRESLPTRARPEPRARGEGGASEPRNVRTTHVASSPDGLYLTPQLEHGRDFPFGARPKAQRFDLALGQTEAPRMVRWRHALRGQGRRQQQGGGRKRPRSWVGHAGLPRSRAAGARAPRGRCSIPPGPEAQTPLAPSSTPETTHEEWGFIASSV